MGLAARRSSRASSRLFSRTLIVNVLRLLAVVVLIWGEFGVYHWSVGSCTWPTPSEATTSEKPSHILLLSDTQLRNPLLHKTWSDYFSHLTYTLYLKRSWHVATRLKPNVVLFLGDQLASGRNVVSQSEYQQYYETFLQTFPLEENVDALYVVGNLDVGMGLTHHKQARNAFSKTFGALNQQVVIHNHTFVLLDAPGLVDEDYTRSARGIDYNDWKPLRDGPVEFVKNVYTDNPLILFTHIPLWRADTSSCGLLRERGTIKMGVGHGSQHLLQHHTTNFLIDNLQPSIIFSGDNRDYCEHVHKRSVSGRGPDNVAVIPEITVKSFSPSRHIRRPGFQLLSLTNPNPTREFDNSFAHDLCLLPDPGFIYWTLYTRFACFIVLLLTLFNMRKRQLLSPHHFLAPLQSHFPTADIPASHPSLITAAWSPYAPPTPTSPLSSLPGAMRTPNAFSGPTFRSASRPETPRQPKPLLSPMPPYPDQEGEEDLLYSPPYASKTHMYETWSADHLEHLEESENGPRVVTPIHSSNNSRKGWALSFTFVFRGRRHRMAIRAPWVSREALKDLIGFLGDGVAGDVKFKRRGILRSTIMDFASVAWVFVGIWTVMAWWSL
ncbi:hypothetical protein BDP27DRAFT_1271654 [Rhodocollybia butyracea]|uniref:Calcineurin-like phosphoesterase domain-containing protein n=1 Tax=Rhodocollybia butyracea TaxID=206335 RepID=A0A9P5PFH0_9AGAR|nr:hypothetical protein BDP27DRAFT_1271654 [Rhodocollybia butyracea]